MFESRKCGPVGVGVIFLGYVRTFQGRSGLVGVTAPLGMGFEVSKA